MSESTINVSGVRQVHMLEMHLSTSIEDLTLRFSGDVKNLESQSFSGFMLLFITENQLVDPTYEITWNFVFRDYGLNKTLSLPGLSTDTFSGTWSIPAYVNASNIQIVAAVYDAEVTNPDFGWPYAVQSVCDVCGHSVAMPGFLPTDLNKDGKIDIRDIALVAKAYGSKPGDPNWNPIADLDGNGFVDIRDIARVAKDYGKTV